MSFTEKANLAQHYTILFNNHFMVYIIFLVLSLILVIILGAISLRLIQKYHFKNRKLYMFIFNIVVIIIAWPLACCLGKPINVTDSNLESFGIYSITAHRDEDHKIIKYDHQLPKLEYKTSIIYKHSLKLHGAKAFSADHAYCIDHRKAKYMKHYLETHNPKAPWINHKF